jgi:FlaA1/EpsC-like NDP-sugar epimerase
MAIFFLFHLDNTSRLNLFVYFAILLIVERYIWRVVIQACFKRGIGLHKLLLVGSNTTAQRFYKEVIATDKVVRYGLDYMGYAALAPNEHIKGYLGGAKAYRDIVAEGKVKDVLA